MEQIQLLSFESRNRYNFVGATLRDRACTKSVRGLCPNALLSTVALAHNMHLQPLHDWSVHVHVDERSRDGSCRNWNKWESWQDTRFVGRFLTKASVVHHIEDMFGSEGLEEVLEPWAMGWGLSGFGMPFAAALHYDYALDPKDLFSRLPGVAGV